MQDFHMIAGTPRSGSTLLANVLAQHPDLYVSGTSSLAGCVMSVQRQLTTTDEVQSELAVDGGSYGRYVASLQGLVDGWYHDQDGVVIDKSRNWCSMKALVDEAFPNSKMILVVRDPRDIMASVEAQHRSTSVFSGPQDTLYERTRVFFAKDGMIGLHMWHIEDMLRRKLLNNTFAVKYESFSLMPREVLSDLSRFLEVEAHSWDIENVVERHTEEDAVWRHKFPHKGSGAIAPSTRDWRNYLDDATADEIISSFPVYCGTFGYS